MVANAMMEPLESRRMLASSLRFGVIGDFGSGTADETAVAAMLKSYKPNLIITTGDNNYELGSSNTIDRNVGRDYHEFIYPYRGAYGLGSADAANHLFPSMGNHDWVTDSGRPYLEYFGLPGNERYYSFSTGPVRFFAISSDPNEPDLGYADKRVSTSDSVQGRAIACRW